MKVYNINAQVTDHANLGVTKIRKRIESAPPVEQLRAHVKSMKSVEGAYALFAGDRFYPEGGMNDFRACGTPEQLVELYAEQFTEWGCNYSPWGQIVDLSSMRMVLETYENEWRVSEASDVRN